MARFFNTAGPCQPEIHYWLPPERRLPQLETLIERRSYFVVHAPRQSGKTTLFRTLATRLREQGRFAAVHASCEAAQAAGGDVDRGVDALLQSIFARSEDLPEPQRPKPVESYAQIVGEYRLASFLSDWSRRSPLPVVLFLDEIDALRGNTLLSVLSQLRDGHPDRPTRFPLSVALIGLRDIRDYRLAPESPFVGKAESLTLTSFSAAEIAELYRQHTIDTGQSWSEDAVVRAFTLTGGHPWLVNALAREATQVIATHRGRAIDLAAIEHAKEAMLLRREFHLGQLLNNLVEPQVEQILEPLLSGHLISPEAYDDLRHVVALGLLKQGPNGLEFSNLIYRQMLFGHYRLPDRCAEENHVLGGRRLRVERL